VFHLTKLGSNAEAKHFRSWKAG